MVQAQEIRKWLEKGVEGEVFPGASAAVFRNGEEPAFAAAGVTRFGPASDQVTPESVFDLASLTKVLSTATIAARLCDRGELQLDEALSRYLEDLPWNEAWTGITVRDVLTHQAGFEAWRNFRKELTGKWRKCAPGAAELRTRVLSEIASSRPVGPRDSRTLYSDLGFILLGERLSRQAAIPLEELLNREVCGPLKLSLLTPDPLRHCPLTHVAATESVKARRGVIHGEVHDDNAFLLGGLCGHAGLFGTSADCLRVGMAWLAALGGSDGYLSRRVAGEFASARSAPDGGKRALGWDVPSGEDSAAGKEVSPGAIGHLGFTGTSIWIDPTRKAVVVLLTNRVHPSAKNEAIRSFRPWFHDAVWRELDR
ncbi:MAG: serine hydrolase domain-containing protein [Pseudomonadota bacterium]